MKSISNKINYVRLGRLKLTFAAGEKKMIFETTRKVQIRIKKASKWCSELVSVDSQ